MAAVDSSVGIWGEVWPAYLAQAQNVLRGSPTGNTPVAVPASVTPEATTAANANAVSGWGGVSNFLTNTLFAARDVALTSYLVKAQAKANAAQTVTTPRPADKPASVVSTPSLFDTYSKNIAESVNTTVGRYALIGGGILAAGVLVYLLARSK